MGAQVAAAPCKISQWKTLSEKSMFPPFFTGIFMCSTPAFVAEARSAGVYKSTRFGINGYKQQTSGIIKMGFLSEAPTLIDIQYPWLKLMDELYLKKIHL